MGSYRKGLLLTLGPLRVAVDLNTVAPARRTGLKRLCPDHKVPLHQQYECPEGHVPEGYVTGKAQAEGGWKIVQPEEKPSVEAAQVLELTPVPAKELADHTFQGGSFYYAQPNSVGEQLNWELFRRSLKDGKTAFVARGAMRRGGEKLWRLDLFRGYLVLREIVFPENIKPAPDVAEVKVDKETAALVKQLIAAKLTEWDKFDSEDTLSKRVEEWIGAGADVEGTKESTPSPKQAVSSLQDALRAAVGA